MTNNTDPSNFLQPNSPENLAFSDLINLIEAPAVLYDRSTDQVLLVNTAYEKFSGLPALAMHSKSLKSIIPTDIDTNPIAGFEHLVGVSTSKGIINCVVNIYPFLKTNKQVILILKETINNGFREELLDQERIFSLSNQIIEARNQPDKDDLLMSFVQLIYETTNSHSISIYTANGDNLIQEKIIHPDVFPPKFLPLHIPIEELSGIDSPTIWKRDREALTLLQQLAYDNSATYLVSIPLRSKSIFLGLVLVYGHERTPDDITFRHLCIIGLAITGALFDLHKQKTYATNLQKLKQVIRLEHTIMDNVEEGVIVLTPDLKIAELNPAAEIILGYNNKEVFKLPVDSVLIGSSSLSSAFKSAQQGITTLASNDLRLHNRNGKSFPAQVITIPVLEQKRVNSIIVLLKDTSQSEIVRVKTQQLEQRAFLGEVSAVFAHEVKNPINSIMTGLQFMGMNMDQATPNYDLVTRMQNDCIRLTYLLDSVLSFSKPVEFHMTKVDLIQMLTGLLDRWSPRMRRLNVTPSFESLLAEPTVTADIRALEQVFINLINNAVQAMEKTGGSLNIKIHPLDEGKNPSMVEVTVSDSGPGIPDDIRDHIFEPFMTTNQNGTGLGLAISKRIITAHKGNIFVESFTGGTIFHVMIPKYIGEEK